MEYYYLNKNTQPTGEHEIHKASCKFLPHMSNCIRLGYFYRAYDALIAAKKYYNNVDGCYYCSPEIHKK